MSPFAWNVNYWYFPPKSIPSRALLSLWWLSCALAAVPCAIHRLHPSFPLRLLSKFRCPRQTLKQYWLGCSRGYLHVFSYFTSSIKFEIFPSLIVHWKSTRRLCVHSSKPISTFVSNFVEFVGIQSSTSQDSRKSQELKSPEHGVHILGFFGVRTMSAPCSKSEAAWPSGSAAMSKRAQQCRNAWFDRPWAAGVRAGTKRKGKPDQNSLFFPKLNAERNEMNDE